MWLLREPPQVHMVDGRLRSAVEEEESAGRAKRKKREEDPRQLGQPKDKAAHFSVGTKRKGVDGRIWEVFMTERLAEIWVPVASKEDNVGSSAENDKEKAKEAAKKAEEALTEAERKEIALEMVLENELRGAGISAKKGYEDLVYEAMIHMMGEAVVGTHTPGAQGTPERRVWCKGKCAGCKRELSMLVVPGLDVVQCTYCAHWSFTNPPTLDELGDGSILRNDPIDQENETRIRTVVRNSPEFAKADAFARGFAKPASAPIRLQDLGPAATKRCSVCANARQRCIYGPNDAACRRCTRGGHICDGVPGKEDGDGGRTIISSVLLSKAIAGKLTSKFSQAKSKLKPSSAGSNALSDHTPPSAPPSPPQGPHGGNPTFNDNTGDTQAVLPPAAPVQVHAMQAPQTVVPVLPHMMQTSQTAMTFAQPFLPTSTLMPVPASSPAAFTAPTVIPMAACAPTFSQTPSFSNSTEHSLFICRWCESGFRGVYRTHQPSSAGDWEAILPFWDEERGAYTQRSLGIYATTSDAATAFATAARMQPPQPGKNGVQLVPDPLLPVLEEAREGGGVDMLKMLRIAVREDLEDGHREQLEMHTSHRSESGFKGVHKSGIGRWQTQVYHEGNLYHAGHSETPEACARVFAVCMRLVDKLREEGSLVQGLAVKRGRRSSVVKEPPPPPPSLPRPRGEVTVEDLAFDGEDQDDLQLHVNLRADSKCQGV
mmetsp:Transcript_21236/g.64769  ORF Transcript_21236/g.64769 Transcript_21236/m.64769 type:complete len:714 (+) Transcript_21236:223-2364(+)